jgi:hypothetical protein
MKYLDSAYDITQAFEKIENELISSMMRNLKGHKAEELKEGFNWEAWQVKQLQALDEYKKRNASKYTKEFRGINDKIDKLIEYARNEGNADEEVRILEAIKKGKVFHKENKDLSAEFFKINDKKLNALIKATKDDFKKAEIATLRYANDQYRRIIFDSQVYASTGAGTYEKAVDMATKDFLARGITSIMYKNGARHTIKEYADMSLRTAGKRAYLTGEGEKRKEWGEHLVIMAKRGLACPKCAKWAGKILIDDIWSGGSQKDGNYKLMSYAVSQGLYHPRCKDSHTTYFGDDFLDDYDKTGYTKNEKNKVIANYNKEQKQKYVERQNNKFSRLAKYSLDSNNKKNYENRANGWKTNNKSDIIEVTNEVLQEYIDSGKVKLEINSNKQGRHIKGAKEYIEGRSYVYGSLDDLQSLVNDLHGTGDMMYKPSGEWNNKEKVIANKKIGVNVDPMTKEETETCKAMIHYSKTGSHIVPRKE